MDTVTDRESFRDAIANFEGFQEQASGKKK